jgi:hypothetical protein
MKAVFLLVASLLVCLPIASGQAKILTNDPLTGLPLIPATDSAKKVGNEPVKMPEGTLCKSKMQGDFYLLYNYFSKDNIKLTDAIAWYTSHLSGFRRVETANHAQTFFYNSDGTILVIVTSEKGAADGVALARAAAYERYQPGISEKTITGMTQNQIVCK